MTFESYVQAFRSAGPCTPLAPTGASADIPAPVEKTPAAGTSPGPAAGPGSGEAGREASGEAGGAARLPADIVHDVPDALIRRVLTLDREALIILAAAFAATNPSIAGPILTACERTRGGR